MQYDQLCWQSSWWTRTRAGWLRFKRQYNHRVCRWSWIQFRLVYYVRGNWVSKTILTESINYIIYWAERGGGAKIPYYTEQQTGEGILATTQRNTFLSFSLFSWKWIKIIISVFKVNILNWYVYQTYIHVNAIIFTFEIISLNDFKWENLLSFSVIPVYSLYTFSCYVIFHHNFIYSPVSLILAGEHKQFCKRINYEETVRVPAFIHVPGLTDDGIITEKLTEIVDLFPTVIEAAGLQPGKAELVLDRRIFDKNIHKYH